MDIHTTDTTVCNIQDGVCFFFCFRHVALQS